MVESRNHLLEALHAVDRERLSAAQLGELLKLTRSTINLLQLEEASTLAAFEGKQAFIELGQHSAVDWLRVNTHVSAASADSQLTLARQLIELEPTVEAVEEGRIGFEQALAIARQVQDLPEEAQAELLEAAASQAKDPGELRRLGEQIRHREDPEGGDRRAYRQHQKRRLRLFEHLDGMLGLEGALPAPEGMKLRTCLESLIGIPAKGDERSQEQRQADALVELCSRSIGWGGLPRQAGRVPQLTVIIREDGAEMEGMGAISPGTVARLCGEDHVERKQVVNGKGVTLNFGRARRLFSPAQRQEISTRHPGCVVEGCTVPIRDCEIHHEEAWERKGDTDVKKGMPLCRRKHHPQVTEGGYLLVEKAGGGYRLIAPPGVEFRPDRWRRRTHRSGP
ncbi:MAG TPA: DUF222 domain-containing protein [Candidatus Dormibacteraeota bacterium]